MVTMVTGEKEDCLCSRCNGCCSCSNTVRPLPPFATDAIPGSEEKIQIMQDRWANGYSLHHPDDLRLASKSIECFSGSAYLWGMILSLEQMRTRGVK